ncbi:uncharacterized protein LOC132042141 [Lycium ferocissimum]|uniref:uncharacterized protein LOC132042141 n=1 Tax=Lycium ferocissimum TaxID=112874 RepID=UPI002815DC8C|nr:uncharacterized protein LOC132042141 [Lycium ferocissimum]
MNGKLKAMDERMVNLPTFQGGSNPKEFLEWKLQSERIFLTNNVSEALKEKYALTQFEGYASTWWESKKLQRAQQHIYDLPTWNDLIELMETRWLPSTYHQDALKRLYMLKQGLKSVEAYFDEFEDLRMKSKIEEHEEYTIIRFVANLNRDISKPMRLKTYNSLEEAFHDASKVEADLKEERSYKDKSKISSTWNQGKEKWKPSTWEKPKITTPTPQAKFDYKARGGDQAKGGNNAKPNFPRPSTIQCFKCQGRGHIASECPNRRTITIVRDGYRTDDENEGVALNHAIVARRSMEALAREESDQRKNLFHARCKILDKVCSLIIDGGSCTNAVNQFLVESMKVPTRKHPSPYKLQWFNESGEMRVTKQAIIQLSIGRYSDEILCDVVPMQACHILLGRPWQFDVDAQHSGRTNKYSFVVKGKKYVLAPLTPHEVREDYRVMKELREKMKNEEMVVSEKETLVAQGGQGSTQGKSKKCMVARGMLGGEERCGEEKDLVPSQANPSNFSIPSSCLVPFVGTYVDDHPKEDMDPSFQVPLEGGQYKELDQIDKGDVLQQRGNKANPSTLANVDHFVLDEQLSRGQVLPCDRISDPLLIDDVSVKSAYTLVDPFDDYIGSSCKSKLCPSSGSTCVDIDPFESELAYFGCDLVIGHTLFKDGNLLDRDI